MHLRSGDAADLAVGCTLLGSGGGGAVTAGQLLLAATLAARGPLPLVAAAELEPTARVACVGAVGSPTVMRERPAGVDEFVAAVRALERHTGHRFDALQPLEIGGVNGLLGPMVAAATGLPLVDGDAMGRAYPRLDHTVLQGIVPATPLALADPGGRLLIMQDAPRQSVEPVVRAVLPALGAWAAICLHSGTAADYAGAAVGGSVSRALTLGRALARRSRDDGADFLAAAGAAVLAEGTVDEVRRGRPGSGDGGVATVRLAGDPLGSLRLDFADEYMAAIVDGAPVVTAPDIIGLLDARTWAPITVERLATQQRVRLVRLPAPEELRDRQARRPDFGLAAYGMAPVRPEEVG
ncbi:DUF917 domain-containing protein [Actinokineospora fastidiosa]|uniref:DUF917 domain-containing protein n=1 Tax=Actinokineospora fastidiosa TaxID=1816 RepID=A0A918GD00_9PSEU|nr:DUF917 domain-containing protein [Actinokineospora fastidiosa]GGS29604.1 hypothetical protein GCM10010171_23650 [Actinokineospora fastidiosa]